MKFGRLETSALSQISWELPSIPSATQVLLDNLPARTQVPAVYVGCSVWADRSFVGKVYPQGTPAKDFLKVYCRYFNTVELNTTFYSIPSIEKVKKWKEVATSGFRFCPKMPRSISHSSNAAKQQRLLDIFIEAVLHFEETLGITFMQLPPYFQPSSMKVLQRLLMYDRGPRSVQPRNDVAGRRDVLHQMLTTYCAFIRFTGNNLHATDYIRIDAWIKRLHLWIEKGLSTIYFLLHEPEKALCVDLATYMIRSLNELGSLQLSSLSFKDC